MAGWTLFRLVICFPGLLGEIEMCEDVVCWDFCLCPVLSILPTCFVTRRWIFNYIRLIFLWPLGFGIHKVMQRTETIGGGGLVFLLFVPVVLKVSSDCFLRRGRSSVFLSTPTSSCLCLPQVTHSPCILLKKSQPETNSCVLQSYF